MDHHAATVDLSTNHAVLLQIVVRALRVQEIVVMIVAPVVVAAEQAAVIARIVIASRGEVVVMIAAETVVATATGPTSNRHRLR